MGVPFCHRRVQTLWAGEPCDIQYLLNNKLWTQQRTLIHRGMNFRVWEVIKCHTHLMAGDCCQYRRKQSMRLHDNCGHSLKQRPVFPKPLTHILGMWLVEMAISTNHMPKIWVCRFENTDLGFYKRTLPSVTSLSSWTSCLFFILNHFDVIRIMQTFQILVGVCFMLMVNGEWHIVIKSTVD